MKFEKRPIQEFLNKKFLSGSTKTKFWYRALVAQFGRAAPF